MNSITIIPFCLALLFMTACTDVEQVVPATLNQQISLSQSSVSPTDFSISATDLDVESDGVLREQDSNCEHRGILLSPFGEDCNPLIRHSDGRLFEVISDNVSLSNFAPSDEISFGFVERPDLTSPCKTAPVIELYCIRYLTREKMQPHVARERVDYTH